MSDSQTLAFFDPNSPTTVVADASPHGLGAVLLQCQDGVEKVIAYGSRSLTDVERRYSQTEREALALVWACEHFMIYLLGIEFALVTDHKPLQYIYNSARSKTTPRIERWALRLLSFDFRIVYKPGPQNIADPLSRLSGNAERTKSVNVAESYVMHVAEMAIPVALSWSDIKRESAGCSELELVRNAVRKND